MIQERHNINTIKESYLCYGCGTCNVVCVQRAISMHYDNIGRLLPIIDNAKCTNCGLCYSNCPGLDMKGIQLPNEEDKYVGHIEKVYIGKALDESIYRNSQSGGLVTATVKYLFESGKIDAAVMCRVEESIEYTPKAVIITNPEDLFSCQKSSYVPIDIISAMRMAEEYSSIAVVGTGCHIQGIHALQNYSKKYKDKIKYTLGLICDRTLCKTVTDVLYGNEYKHEKKRIIWRDKSHNYKYPRLLIRTSMGKQKELPQWKRHALKDPFTNPRCRICFDKLNTHADMVFGDPWGMNNVDWDGGMSVVLSRSVCGSIVISNMLRQEMIELKEAPLEEVIKGQNIERRKKEVSAALAYYKSQGWMLPSYASSLNLSEVDPRLKLQIRKFVKDSKINKREIINKNLSILRIIRIKSSLNSLIDLSIRIIRKILKQ